MNKTLLIGRLTKDPEKKSTPNGTIVCNFTVAVDRPFTNQKTGQREADFINCITFNKSAENLCIYCHKGSQIAVEGRIQTRSYDKQDGTKAYVTEVLCEHITFLGSKPASEPQEHNAENDIEVTTKEVDPYESFGEQVKMDDVEVPFDFD